MYLSDFKYPHPFRRYSPSNSEVRTQAKFCMFFSPKIKFFLGPKILDQNYKGWPTTNHCAEFHDAWPTQLKDLALKKISVVKHKFALCHQWFCDWGQNRRQSPHKFWIAKKTACKSPTISAKFETEKHYLRGHSGEN